MLNGKYYVGKHSTNNLNDGYIGSCDRLRKSVKKYGKEKADSITNPEMNLRQSLMWLLLIITGGIFVIDTLYFDGALLYSIFH